MENQKKEMVLDTSVLLSENLNLKMIKKIIHFLLPDEPTGEIIILDSVYDEVEKMKKQGIRRAKEIYKDISERISDESVVYKDVEYNDRGVDGSVIDYCIENNSILLTLDKRMFARYKFKMNEKKQDILITVIKERELKELIYLYNTLEKITENNLGDILKIVLGIGKNKEELSKIDFIDFIDLSPVERYNYIVEFIIDNSLNSYDEENKIKIKKIFFKNKSGEIESNLVKKVLNNIPEVRIPKLNIKEVSLKEKNNDLIKRFLVEKGFASFEELEKAQPFKRENELVEGIIKYYK